MYLQLQSFPPSISFHGFSKENLSFLYPFRKKLSKFSYKTSPVNNFENHTNFKQLLVASKCEIYQATPPH